MKSKNKEAWIFLRNIALTAIATGVLVGITSVLTSRYLSGLENAWWRYPILFAILAAVWFFVWKPLSRREKAREERKQAE